MPTGSSSPLLDRLNERLGSRPPSGQARPGSSYSRPGSGLERPGSSLDSPKYGRDSVGTQGYGKDSLGSGREGLSSHSRDPFTSSYNTPLSSREPPVLQSGREALRLGSKTGRDEFSSSSQMALDGRGSVNYSRSSPIGTSSRDRLADSGQEQKDLRDRLNTRERSVRQERLGQLSDRIDHRSSMASISSMEREGTSVNMSNYKTRPEGHQERAIVSERQASSLSSRQGIQLEDEHRVKSSGQKNSKKKKRKNQITANLSGTRYEVIRQMSELLGISVAKDDDPNSYLIWNDSFVSTERISELKSYQKINHFPGMGEICRKDCLARNMAKLTKIHEEEFNFVPKTWIFPAEYSAFQNYARELKKKKKTKTFIVKPANGAMGNGIFLYRNAEKIPQNEHTIVQEYIDKPLLVDGYKCDMRIYVLVTSCDPLRAFLYSDGLLRMSTEKYIQPTDGNIDHLFMHLTNYSVNKHNTNFEKTGTVDTGSKRSLKWFNDYLRRHDYDVAYLWRNITDMILKTLVVSHPHVLHAYRMCRPGQPPGSDSVSFEILGFDVLLDRKLRPWLIEINRSPSFGTDETLDYDIKSGVIEDSLRLLNIKASDKRKNMAAQKAQAQKRLLRPNKRIDGDVTDLEKKKMSVERKREELKDMLIRMKKESSREDYENRNSGRFKRIFPPDDKFLREKYAKLLSDAYGCFMSGRGTSLQQEIQRTYNNNLREEDVIDMLAQCEADEKEGRIMATNKPRGPKQSIPLSYTHAGNNSSGRFHNPLQSMPTLSRDHLDDEDMEDDDDDDGDTTEGSSPTLSRGLSRSNTQWSESGPGRPVSAGRPNSRMPAGRTRSLTQPAGYNKLSSNQLSEEALILQSQKEREEDLTRRTLTALNDMRIKFPGKSDEEAEYILDKLHENWKFHKPRIASYWLVKLDSIKRRKVIDIVRSNVRAVIQRTWKCPDIDNLKLYRIFSRVFNRLLWSHGQGLWNCFQTSGNSWETIFSKSTDSISGTEMACCRRIVQLCRDCLLIVYQFAAEAKHTGSPTSQPMEPELKVSRTSSAVNGTKPVLDNGGWNPSQAISQRISRLYQSRSTSLNSINGTS